MDSGGALYGTTYAGGMTGGGWGTVFMLTPPPVGKTQWTKTLLHAFTNGADGSHPRGGVIIDSKGALYGTTADGGLAGKVFKLTPPPAGRRNGPIPCSTVLGVEMTGTRHSPA